MKATGIVRRIDDLGRLVLPIELRKMMNMAIRDPLEIYVHEDTIVLKKYIPACIFCGSADDLLIYKDHKVCKECVEAMAGEIAEKE